MENNKQIDALLDQLGLMITVPNPQNVGAWSSEVKQTRNALFGLLDEEDIDWEKQSCAGYERQRALKKEVNLLLRKWESVLDARVPKAQPRRASAAQKPYRKLLEVTLPDDLDTIENALRDARITIYGAASRDSLPNLLDAVGQYCALLLQADEKILGDLVRKGSYNSIFGEEQQRALQVSISAQIEDWISFAEGISQRDLSSFYPK